MSHRHRRDMRRMVKGLLLNENVVPNYFITITLLLLLLSAVIVPLQGKGLPTLLPLLSV